MRIDAQRTDPVLEAGTRVGDFVIRELLGEGAMGQVYLAEDTVLGRRVALKLIKRAVLQGDGAGRFLAEARATASFSHPHIVTLYAVGEHAGRPYLALEFIDGESLRARLLEGPLPVGEALRCCRAVADAIAEAHRRGFVHADLKPENIVVARDGRVRVVDFGLARLARGAVHAASGTPAYMAPERWRDAPPTGAIDVWALGVTLHELVIGVRPIPDAALLHLPFAASTLPLPNLPPAPWARIVRACLALKPADRPTAQWLVYRLSELVDAPHHLRAELARGAPRPLEGPAEEIRACHPRVALSGRSAGPPADAWLAPVVERMVRRDLRDRHDRRFHVVERAGGATRIDLVVTRAGDQLRIDAVNTGDARVVASAADRSVAGAVRTLAAALERALGAGLEPAGPDPEEVEEMRCIGATSVELFRRYRRVLHAHFATSLPDLSALATAMRRIIAADPTWAHAYALLAVVEGVATDAARSTLATARAVASEARDPSGMRLVDAMVLASRGAPEPAFLAMEELFRLDEADLLTGALLPSWAMLARRMEEGIAITRRLHVKHPALLFGMDLAEWLRWEARDDDADRLIREWVAAAPENLPARVDLVRIEAALGHRDQAQAQARQLAELHGGCDDALPDLFEALVALDRFSDSRAVADRMLAGSPANRAYGRYRIAMLSVLEGRFAAAYDAVRRAITEHRAFGMRSELTQGLQLARSIAPLVADVQAERRYIQELIDVFDAMIGDAGVVAALRFELALLDRRGAAPAMADHLAGLDDGPMRDVARRRMLRAAALAGHGEPRDAVAAGFSTAEENTASLVAFGQCARAAGELELARWSFQRAIRRWSSLTNNQCSPYHAVLARFHLAGVLEELGELGAARAAYEAFLRCWSSPDRPVPEVALARAALAGADRQPAVPNAELR